MFVAVRTCTIGIWSYGSQERLTSFLTANMEALEVLGHMNRWNRKHMLTARHCLVVVTNLVSDNQVGIFNSPLSTKHSFAITAYSHAMVNTIKNRVRMR
jgi:hypothetical protein